MKHKLNLNGPSGPILALIGLLLVALPTALYLLSRGLGALRLPGAAVLLALARGSVALGLAALGGFALLIAVELWQDRHMDRVYEREGHRRIPLGDGLYECPFCGNRQVRAAERSCPVCGWALE